MDTSIFKYGELPEFKKFTPENISKEFPKVLEKIAEVFKTVSYTHLTLPTSNSV